MSYASLIAVGAAVTQAIVGLNADKAICYNNAKGETAAIDTPLSKTFLEGQCTKDCAQKKRTKPFFYQVQSQEGARVMINVGEAKCWIDPKKFKVQVLAQADAPSKENKCSEHQGVLGAGPTKCSK